MMENKEPTFSMDIVIQQGSSFRDKLSVIVNGELFCYLHPSIFGRNVKLSAIDLDELREKIASLEYSGAKRYILNRLSKKSYHSIELHKLLEDKGVSEEFIQKLIAKCCEWGFIDDEKWIESYIVSQRRQKRGDRLIAMKLKNKGLKDSAIAYAFESLQNPEIPLANIRRLLDSRYRSRNLADFKEKNKVIASLIRQGFIFSDIIAVLKEKDA